MEIRDIRIDGGKAFDWGKTSEDYAKYRDIYPEVFYQKIADRGLCVKGQKILDIGTGTGVLPRNMYKYGGEWVATDISPEQIDRAEKLSVQSGFDIKYLAVPTEKLSFTESTFDVVTACQCFWYFDHKTVAPILSDLLKKDGKLLLLYMAWLPYEDKIAGASEELVLSYSPNWSGAGERVRPIEIPSVVYDYFEPVYHEEYKVSVPFTKESWHGRIRACRGVGASLSEEELARFDREHKELLKNIAPERFEVLHYAAMAELKVKKVSLLVG